MSEAKKYRKRPVVIEAMQWDGTAEGATPIIDWILRKEPQAASYDEAHVINPGFPDEEWVPARILINTLEGTMSATSGDYIIRGVQNEFYPIKPDILDATYEAVSDD